MSPERFRRIEQIFAAAAELDSTARAAYLERQCAADSALLDEVRSLLDASPAARDQLETLVYSGADWLTSQTGPARHIGPYRILETVAGGGMGSVYRAVRDDGQYQKHVAIKLIRDAFALDDQFVRRFLEERQILARMEHPNIARLLDGGVTADRVPYLVMELVDGKPITSYCRTAGLETTLRLFREVCSAVHYAHRNLVVHRDIKPGNILVTADGQPKLLDFGIAKALNSGQDLTRTGISPMTLDYASPEQVRGDPVTTASDVYSLGLLLYELLTHQRAHRFADTSSAEILRVVCEADPPLPSAAAPDSAFGGDLDNIVMKAIRKSPAERYGSAEQLAGDIRRYQEGLPVEARPATLGYLTSKFVERNKVSVAAGATVAVALLLGGILTWRQARIAERRFELVRGLANSVVFEVDPALEQVAGTTPARRIIIDRASTYLDKLSADSQGDRKLQEEVASAYEKLAGVKGNPNQSNLGDLPGAVESYERALAIRRQLVAREPGSAEYRSLLAADKASLGLLQSERGETKKGRELLQQAVDECKGIEFASPDVARRIGLAHVQLARLTSNRSNVKASFDFYDSALRILGEAAKRFPDSDFRPEIALAHSGTARAYRESSQLPKALEAAQKAVDLQVAVVTSNPAPNARRELLMAHQTMGDVLGAPGQFSLNRTGEAVTHYEKSMAIAEELAAADPRSYRAQRDLMVASNRLGDITERLGDRKKALSMFERSVRIVEALEANDHRPPIRLDLASSLARVADRLYQQGRKEEGLALNRRAMKIRESVVEADPTNAEAKRHLMLSAASFGDDLRREGKLAEAEPLLRKSLDLARTLSMADPSDALSNRYVAVASELVAGVLFDQKRYTEACPHYQDSLGVIQRVSAAGVAVDSDAEGIVQLRKELDACLTARDGAARRTKK